MKTKVHGVLDYGGNVLTDNRKTDTKYKSVPSTLAVMQGVKTAFKMGGSTEERTMASFYQKGRFIPNPKAKAPHGVYDKVRKNMRGDVFWKLENGKCYATASYMQFKWSSGELKNPKPASAKAGDNVIEQAHLKVMTFSVCKPKGKKKPFIASCGSRKLELVCWLLVKNLNPKVKEKARVELRESDDSKSSSGWGKKKKAQGTWVQCKDAPKGVIAAAGAIFAKA